MAWLISLPAWGEHYVKLAKQVALPSIAAALSHSSQSHLVVVHTNTPEEFHDCCGLTIATRPLPTGGRGGWNEYPASQFEVCRMALTGDHVSVLPADCCVSREFFAECERLLASGKKVVASDGTRTLSDEPPPIGASARELTNWAMEHLHPINRECFWSTGRSALPSVMYFADGENVVKHCFHLGPVGFRIAARNYRFEQSTDGAFMESFQPEEIHIAQSMDMALIECSPASKCMGLLPGPYNKETVLGWAKSATTPIHRWMFQHPIIMRGKDTGRSQPVVKEILRALG